MNLRLSCLGAPSLGGLLTLAACAASMPDVARYVDATRELRGAVEASGRAGLSNLQTLAHADPEVALSVERLRGAWALRIETLDAMVAYAETVERIAATDASNSDVANEVADGLAMLAEAALGERAVAVVREAAVFIEGQLERVRAAKSLEDALLAASPAVAKVAEVLRLDLDDLRAIIRVVHEAQRGALRTEHNEALGFRNGLLDQRKSIYAKGAELDAEDAARLLFIAEQLKATQDWQVPFEAELARLGASEVANVRLVDAAKEGVTQWARLYLELEHAFRKEDEGGPSARNLRLVAVEIEGIAERIREL